VWGELTQAFGLGCDVPGLWPLVVFLKVSRWFGKQVPLCVRNGKKQEQEHSGVLRRMQVSPLQMKRIQGQQAVGIRSAFREGLWFRESGRQSCFKTDLLSGDGVVEVERLGVQEIASVAGEAGEMVKWLAGWPVQRIAYQRMADGGQVDSDLVRAA
jgi:hypothetical protein